MVVIPFRFLSSLSVMQETGVATYSNSATGWTVCGLNPGHGKRFSLSQNVIQLEYHTNTFVGFQLLYLLFYFDLFL
jgi:hypothetical protein